MTGFVRRHALDGLFLLVGVAIALIVYVSLNTDDFAHALAQERTASIYRECRQQNQRHDRTVAELDTLLTRAERHAPPTQRREEASSREFTILLIDQLAPKQNCQRVVSSASRP